ncbi:hypothetical protein [Motilibacter deserti]|uniref:AbiEi antitoxin of type IV toxin-antitoxin system n=1 Tax=Motilibacter deserti TaxID=2714956 RepID=A0ABX0GPQ3_9ACTN|nr:hypothetical protein [Motilibacter deserti]NHC12697.1 hypothetical protein [Motilibacter deserti]
MREAEAAVYAWAELHSGLVSRRRAIELGMTPGQVKARLSARVWLPLVRGLYLVDPARYESLSFEVKARAALLAHPGAALAGTSAARWWGVEGLRTDDDEIELVLPRPLHRPVRQGLLHIRVRQWQSTQSQWEVVRGVPVTGVARTLADACLSVSRPEALSLLDSALHKGLILPTGLPEVEQLAQGRRGCVQLRALLGLADGRAESPIESRVRLACVDGNVPPDHLQLAVRDDHGVLIAIGDLGWRRPGGGLLLGEADGAVHDSARSVRWDRHRSNEMTILGIDTVRFTWADALRPPYVASTVRRALSA